MKLLTNSQRQRLLANGVKPGDHRPVVKWFNPCGAATWLASELDPEDPDIAHCLADLGMGFPEIGSVRISELEAFRGRLGLGIERDLHFRAKAALSVYAEAARDAGRIVESAPDLDETVRRQKKATNSGA